MFPSMYNLSGIQAVKNALEARQELFPPTDCVFETLKLCLKSKNSVFNDKHFLQANGTDQAPHMSCSYSDIPTESFDKKAPQYQPSVIGWIGFEIMCFYFGLIPEKIWVCVLTT